jgi:hypothetical protein
MFWVDRDIYRDEYYYRPNRLCVVVSCLASQAREQLAPAGWLAAGSWRLAGLARWRGRTVSETVSAR